MDCSRTKQIGRRSRALASILLVSLALPFGAYATQLPADFTVEGRLYSASGVPLTTAVDIKLELVDENTPTCVIYRELRPGVDVSSVDPNAQGVFSLRLGAVTADFGQGTLSTLFAPGAYTGDGCTITTAPGSHRLVRIWVSAASQNAYEHLQPDTRVTAVPVAMVAENAMTIQGIGTTSLLILNSSSTSSLQQPNFDYLFTTTNYVKLKALVDGTSALYLDANPSSPVPFNGQALTNLANPTNAQDAATKSYVDQNFAGKPVDVSAVGPMTGQGAVMQWDATQNKWVAGALSTTPTGTASGDLAGTYPAPTIRDGAVTSSKFGSTNAGVNRLLITDAVNGNSVNFGYCALNQVYAWTATGWACTDASSLSAVLSVAGKKGVVTLNAGDITGFGTAALYDVGTGANQIPRLDNQGRLPVVDGSQLLNVNATKLQSYPVANIAPGLGQVLGWNGTAWVPTLATAGSVTSVGGGVGLLGGPITSTGTLRVDVGTGGNQIVQLSPTAQLPAVDGSLLTSVSAAKLLGRTISSVNPTNGQVLGWNQTASQWQGVSAATGTMTSITATNGITGGIITTVGTIGVDTGTTANKILQLNSNAQISAVDGSLLFNINASKLQARPVSSTQPIAGQVLGWNMTSSQWEPTSTAGGTMTSIAAGSGLLGNGLAGGSISTSGTIAVDVGTAANKIVQLNSSAQLPSVDGSLLTNVNTTKLQTRAISSSMPSTGQVLGWNQTTSVWEPTSNGTSQWINGSGGIYYAGGNVGIGTPTSALPLTVVGTAQVDSLVVGTSGTMITLISGFPFVQPTIPNQPGQFMIAPSGSGITASVGVTAFSSAGSSNTTFLKQFSANASLLNGGSGSITFGTNGITNQMVLSPTGGIGMNTATPAAGLDLAFIGTANSALIVPRDTSANRPSAPVNGMLRYNTSSSAMEGYINGTWATISAGSSAGTLQSISTGTGLLGGPTITTNGTISVDVGSNAGQIVRENALSQIAQLNGTLAAPAYSFAGNTSTGLYNPGTNQLALVTNGSAAMTIASNGDVMFTSTTVSTSGTTGAVQVAGGLGVAGNLVTTGSVTSPQLATYSNVPGTYTNNTGSGYPQGSSVNIFNASAANQQLAEVVLFPRNAANTQAAYIGALSNASGNTPSIVIGAQSGPSSYAERLRIDVLGNVGIGTSAPGAGLDVATTGSISSAIIVPRDTTANRPTGTNGMLRYNTTSLKFEAYQNGAWLNVVTTGTSTAATASPSQVQFATSNGVGGSSNFTYAEPAGLSLNAPIAVTGTATFSNSTTFAKTVAQGVVSDSVGSIDGSAGNLFTSSFACGSNFNVSNLVSGGSYTVVVTDSGTTSCGFSSSGGFNFYFMPPNDARIASSHTIYNLMVIGTRVYVNWTSGFQ